MERSLRVFDKEILEEQFFTFLKRLEAETNMKTQDALIKTDSKELIIDYIAFFISKPVWTNRACNASNIYDSNQDQP